MLKLKIGVTIILLASSSVVKADASMPKDIEQFIWDREGCDHFRGEIPGPAAKQRMQVVLKELDRLCKGTDKRLAKLKKKYSNDANIIRMLNEFEPDIESNR